jgi:hypothetical protein
VTTKTEQGSGTSEPPARSADLTGDAERDAERDDERLDDERPVDSLPSIIVDPSAFAAVANPRDDGPSASSLPTDGGPEAGASTHDVAPESNGAAHAHDTREGDVAASDERAAAEADDRFSVEEAERFAEHFRPSWDSLPAVAPAPVAQETRSVAIAPDLGEPIESVLPFRQRRRFLMVVGAAVCSFVALTALAMMSASHDAAATADTQARPPAVSAPAAAVKPTDAQPATLPPPAAPAAIPREVAAAAGAAAEPPTAALPAAEPATAVPTEQPAAPPNDPAPAAPGALALAPPGAPEAATAQAKMVRIQLKTVPTSATLLIDGNPVANPFDQVVAESGKHRVQASAQGYRESDFTLSFDRPRDLALRLQKVRGVRKPAVRRAVSRASATPARAPTTASREPAKLVVRPIPDEPPAKPAPVAPKPAKGAGFVSESPY